jgi:hypothetical protein
MTRLSRVSPEILSVGKSFHRGVGFNNFWPRSVISCEVISDRCSTACLYPKAETHCLFCDRDGHSAEDCWSYQIIRERGEPNLVKMDRKAKGKARGKQTHTEISNTSYCSFSAGRAASSGVRGCIVLDTGSTVNIFRDKEFFSELVGCDESVIGVGGDRIAVTLKGPTPSLPSWLLVQFHLVSVTYSTRILTYVGP